MKRRFNLDWIFTGGIALVLVYITLFVLVCSGYVFNIIQLISMDTIVWSGIVIVKVIGVFFPPLGALMGWFF